MAARDDGDEAGPRRAPGTSRGVVARRRVHASARASSARPRKPPRDRRRISRREADRRRPGAPARGPRGPRRRSTSRAPGPRARSEHLGGAAAGHPERVLARLGEGVALDARARAVGSARSSTASGATIASNAPAADRADGRCRRRARPSARPTVRGRRSGGAHDRRERRRAGPARISSRNASRTSRISDGTANPALRTSKYDDDRRRTRAGRRSPPASRAP